MLRRDNILYHLFLQKRNLYLYILHKNGLICQIKKINFLRKHQNKLVNY